jgi:hypothetical protein
MYWQKKAVKKTMKLQYEDDDDILGGLQSAMKQYNIDEAKILDCKGKIKSGLGNYMDGSQFLTKNFSNTEIKKGGGHFKLTKTGIFGVLRVIPNDNKNDLITIGKAKAANGFEIDISYYEYPF